MTGADGWRDGRVAELAGRQRTIVSHVQLLGLGGSRRVIAHWVSSGRLQIVFHGIYSIVAGDLPLLALEQAALLACGDRAFLSHHTAAFIWGMRNGHPAEVDVSVVARRCSSRKGIRVHELKAIDRGEVQRHEGLWMSSPARALLEIAASRSVSELADALEAGLAGKVLKPREVQAVLARHRGYRGVGRLAELLAGGGGEVISKSRAEKAFIKLIREAGLPMPAVNQRFGNLEPDFFWRRERLVVEIDGYPFHSGPRSLYKDREKDLVLRDARIDVMRFTRYHVVHQGARVLARVAGELARRPASDQ